jgi:hypothetical protein
MGADVYVPLCVQRTGKECRDCVECLSALPAGLTCETACRHVEKCKAIFGQKGTEAYCQWVPSRFTPSSTLNLRGGRSGDGG